MTLCYEKMNPLKNLKHLALCNDLYHNLLQVVDQNIKNVEDLQDEYDFNMNTLKNRGEGFYQQNDVFNMCLCLHVNLNTSSSHLNV